MKRRETPANPIPVHDYEPARQNAVSWLGDRYLLAAPAVKRPEEPKAFFTDVRNWHRALRPRLITRH